MSEFLELFKPYGRVSSSTRRLTFLVLGALGMLFWCFPPSVFIPTPLETLRGIGHMWAYDGLSRHLFTSVSFIALALSITTVVSLGLAYLTVLPIVRPIVAFLSKNRAIGFTGLPFLFTATLHDIEVVKLILMVFAMTVWFVTDMAETVASVSTDDLDYARTLGFGPWRVVWEMVILASAARAWETIRVIAAMGFMVLSPIEMVTRSNGGIGVIAEIKKKSGDFDMILGIMIISLLITWMVDQVLQYAKRKTCPWAGLRVERL